MGVGPGEQVVGGAVLAVENGWLRLWEGDSYEETEGAALRNAGAMERP